MRQILRRLSARGREEIHHERIEAAGPSLSRARQRAREVDAGRRARPNGWENMTPSQRDYAVDPEYRQRHNEFLRSLSNIVGFK